MSWEIILNPFVFNELGDHLEWILFPGNPGDELSGVIKTITKEGLDTSYTPSVKPL